MWKLVEHILAIISYLIKLLESIFSGKISEKIYKDSETKDEKYKYEKGRIDLFLGKFGLVALIGIIIIIIIIIVKLLPDDNVEELSQGSNTTFNPKPEMSNGPSITPTDNTSLYYVKDMLFAEGTYSGFVDEVTRLPDGNGVMKYLDNSKYDGEWENGKFQGSGDMIYNNGDEYNGEWQNGKKCGYGVYIWSDGKQYAGEYLDDMRDGEGTYTGWTGFVLSYGWKGNYYGASKENKFEGMGRFEFDNGDKFEGIFHADQFWDGVYTRKDGSEYLIKEGISFQLE